MKLLLDTNAFIWWSEEPERLSEQAFSLCQDRDNVLFLSMAGIWEMQIKVQLGKLKLEDTLRETIAREQQLNQLNILPIEIHHIWALENLPSLHKDPFDRMIIAQA